MHYKKILKKAKTKQKKEKKKKRKKKNKHRLDHKYVGFFLAFNFFMYLNLLSIYSIKKEKAGKRLENKIFFLFLRPFMG